MLGTCGFSLLQDSTASVRASCIGHRPTVPQVSFCFDSKYILINTTGSTTSTSGNPNIQRDLARDETSKRTIGSSVIGRLPSLKFVAVDKDMLTKISNFRSRFFQLFLPQENGVLAVNQVCIFPLTFLNPEVEIVL